MKKKVNMILLFTITLEGVRFTDVIKKNGLSLSFLETVMVIDKSEGLSGQILLLGRKAEYTGLLTTLVKAFCAMLTVSIL